MKYSKSEVFNAVVFKVGSKMQGGPEAEGFHKEIAGCIESGKKNVIMDLSDVKYVSSTGMGIMVRALTTLRNNEGDLKLAGLSTKVEGLLSITKFSDIVENYATVEEAANSF
jgi:anti-sigma B factor antagonist